MRSDLETRVAGELLLEASLDAIIAIGKDERITAWNNTATSLFDHPPEYAIGNSLFDLLPSFKDDCDLQTAIKKAWEGKKSFLPASAEFSHRKQVETHVIPLRNSQPVSGVMLVVRDVSRQVAIEAELKALNEELNSRLQQLNSTRNELARITQIASHNIREPLRLVYTGVEFLLSTEAASLSNSGKASFRRIQASLNRINLLLDDIITLTQINIADRPVSIINMNELIGELRIKFAKRLKDSRTVLTVGSLCNIRAHRNQIILLLEHIISNVIKFTDGGDPAIHLNCEKTWYNPSNGDRGRAGEYFKLSITHNSAVFDDLEPTPTLYVQDNNETRSYTGPAIAMILSAKIMEAHSGFILTEKLNDGNTRICCYFPMIQPELSNGL